MKISSKTQILENCNAALESANEVREKAAEYKQLPQNVISYHLLGKTYQA